MAWGRHDEEAKTGKIGDRGGKLEDGEGAEVGGGLLSNISTSPAVLHSDTEKNIMQQQPGFHWIAVIHCPILNCQAVKLHQVCQNSFQDYGGDMKN